MDNPANNTGSLRAANIFGQVRPLIARHGLGMTALAVPLVSAPQAITSLLFPLEVGPPSIAGIVQSFVVALAQVAISAYLGAWWARLVWRDDQPADQPIARLTPGVALSIAATAVLVQAGISIGLLALIVPGILFGLATWVALPITAVEGLGPMAAISRSWALTRGRRSGILGIAALAILPTLAISIIGQQIITGWPPLTVSNRDPIVLFVWRPICFAPMTMFTALVVAVVYRALRKDAAPA